MNAQSKSELPAFKTVPAGTNRLDLKEEPDRDLFFDAESNTEPTPRTIEHDFEVSTEPVSTELWCKLMDDRCLVAHADPRFRCFQSPDFEDCRLFIRRLNRHFRGSCQFRLPTQDEFLAAASDDKWKSECLDREWIDGCSDGKVRFLNASSPAPTIIGYEPDWRLPPPCGFHLVRTRKNTSEAANNPTGASASQSPSSEAKSVRTTDSTTSNLGGENRFLNDEKCRECETHWFFGSSSVPIVFVSDSQTLPRIWVASKLVSGKIWDVCSRSEKNRPSPPSSEESQPQTNISWEDCLWFLETLNSKYSDPKQRHWYYSDDFTLVPGSAGRFRLLLASEWEALMQCGALRVDPDVAEWCLDGPGADYPDGAVREDLWDDGFARHVCGGAVKAPGDGVSAAFPKVARSDGIGFRLVWEETNYKLVRRPRRGCEDSAAWRFGIADKEPLVGYLDDLFQDAFRSGIPPFDATFARQSELDKVEVLEVPGPSPVLPADDGFREIWRRTLKRARELSDSVSEALFEPAILEKAGNETMRDMPREKRGEWARHIRDGASGLFDKVLGTYSANERTIRLYSDMIADTAEGLSIDPGDLESVVFLHEFSHWTHHAIVSDFPRRRFSNASAELLECIAQLLPFKALELASTALRSEHPTRLMNAFLLLNFKQSSKYSCWKEFKERSSTDIVRALLALRADETQAPDLDCFRNSLLRNMQPKGKKHDHD